MRGKYLEAVLSMLVNKLPFSLSAGFFYFTHAVVEKYCDEYICVGVSLSVCLSACVSVHEDISATTRVIFIKFVMHVAYVHGSVLLRHVDNRPHRLSAGRGEKSAQCRRSVIYDWLVICCVSKCTVFLKMLFRYVLCFIHTIIATKYNATY